MRLASARTIVAVLAACLALLVAGTVGAEAGRRAPVGSARASEPASRSEDVCDALHAGVEDARFACVRTSNGGAWAVRIDPPAPGARDLVLSAVRVDAQGARSESRARLEGAAPWWPTIAPLERGISASGDALVVDVTRMGFREYAVGHAVFSPPA